MNDIPLNPTDIELADTMWFNRDCKMEFENEAREDQERRAEQERRDEDRCPRLTAEDLLGYHPSPGDA